MLPAIKRQSAWLPTIFNDFFNDDWFPLRAASAAPAINVKETDKAYHIEMAVPGMTKEDFVKLGIDEDLAKKCEEASQEELKGFIPKARFDEVNTAKNTAEALVKERNEQLETFLEAIKGHEYWCDFFYVEVMTGLRRGEICGLKWQDINFEENKLQVKRSVSVKKGGGVSIGETKTETGVRCIQMPPSVAELLKSKKQTAITEWVFPHFQHPEQPISPASAYRKLKVILKNAELPLIRFHDLRHTFATHGTQGGVDPKTLAGILGHTNASFTLDTYTHVTSDMQKSASAVVGNMMQKIMIKE